MGYQSDYRCCQIQPRCRRVRGTASCSSKPASRAWYRRRLNSGTWPFVSRRYYHR